METGETGRCWGLGRGATDRGAASRREALSSSVINEFTERIRPFEDLKASFFSFSCRYVSNVGRSLQSGRIGLPR